MPKEDFKTNTKLNFFKYQKDKNVKVDSGKTRNLINYWNYSGGLK